MPSSRKDPETDTTDARVAAAVRSSPSRSSRDSQRRAVSLINETFGDVSATQISMNEPNYPLYTTMERQPSRQSLFRGLAHLPTGNSLRTGSRLESPSSMTTSLRACRICQSETGPMVRPCGCAGTMGAIHEGCLSKWVIMSNKVACEICNEEYAKSGEQYKTLRNWTKPNLDGDDLISAFILIGLCYSVFYMTDMLRERYFFERILSESLPCRSDDVGRLMVLTILCFTLMTHLMTIIRQMRQYLGSQKEIRFVNKTATAGPSLTSAAPSGVL